MAGTKIDKAKAQQIIGHHDNGESPNQIASATGISAPTIRRYIEMEYPRKDRVTQFNAILKDLLPEQLLKCMVLQDNLLESISADDVLSLTVIQRFRCMKENSVVMAILMDKYEGLTGKISNKSHEIQVNIVHQQLDYYATPEHLKKAVPVEMDAAGVNE